MPDAVYAALELLATKSQPRKVLGASENLCRGCAVDAPGKAVML
jgi:hypothetical protein